jgi:2-dehydro-3-deoxygluconokinase
MIRIASIGECMIELRHRSEAELELSFGGDTLNTAAYLARLLEGRDAEVHYVTALGTDPYSTRMIETWHAEGIRTAHVARLPDRLPGLYTIRTDAAGERTFTYWRGQSAARHALEDERGEDLLEALAGFDLLYASGITLSILDAPQRGTLLEIAEAVRAHGGKVAFDTNYRPVAWPDPVVARHAFDEMLRRTDIALPTLEDDRKLFGVAGVAACAERMHQLGVAGVVVKLGERGATISRGGELIDVPVKQLDAVVDSTAAGDSFNAGYLAGRLTGTEPRAAAELGNRLANIVIRHRGAVIPRHLTADLKA